MIHYLSLEFSWIVLSHPSWLCYTFCWWMLPRCYPGYLYGAQCISSPCTINTCIISLLRAGFGSFAHAENRIDEKLHEKLNLSHKDIHVVCPSLRCLDGFVQEAVECKLGLYFTSDRFSHFLKSVGGILFLCS